MSYRKLFIGTMAYSMIISIILFIVLLLFSVIASCLVLLVNHRFSEAIGLLATLIVFLMVSISIWSRDC